MSIGASAGTDANNGVFQVKALKNAQTALLRRATVQNRLSNRIAPCRFEPYRPETVDYCGVDGS